MAGVSYKKLFTYITKFNNLVTALYNDEPDNTNKITAEKKSSSYQKVEELHPNIPVSQTKLIYEPKKYKNNRKEFLLEQYIKKLTN